MSTGTEQINAITIWQPYASLLSEGFKLTETRSWAPPLRTLREPIAIHSGSRKVKLDTIPFHVQRKMQVEYGDDWRTQIAYGCILAVGTLDSYYWVTGGPRTDDTGQEVVKAQHVKTPGQSRLTDPRHVEIPTDPWGDYSTGRYIWKITDLKPLESPIKTSGSRNLWKWDRA